MSFKQLLKIDELELNKGEFVIFSKIVNVSGAMVRKPGNFIITNQRLVFIPSGVKRTKILGRIADFIANTNGANGFFINKDELENFECKKGIIKSCTITTKNNLSFKIETGIFSIDNIETLLKSFKKS